MHFSLFSYRYGGCFAKAQGALRSPYTRCFMKPPFCPRNCIKCQDLKKKVIFAKGVALISDLQWKSCSQPPSPWDRVRWVWIKFPKNCLLRIKWNIQICREKSCLKPPHPEDRGQFPGIHLLRINWNFQLYKKELCLQHPISMEKGWGGRAWGKVVKNSFARGIAWNVQIYTEKSYLQSPNAWKFGRGRGQFFKNILLGINWYIQICTEVMSQYSTPWSGGKVPTNSSARNCMKCPGLHRKEIFTKTLPLEGGVGCRSISKQCFS